MTLDPYDFPSSSKLRLFIETLKRTTTYSVFGYAGHPASLEAVVPSCAIGEKI